MNNNSFREELFKKGQALIDSKGKGIIISNVACEKNG